MCEWDRWSNKISDALDEAFLYSSYLFGSFLLFLRWYGWIGHRSIDR
jgi:hypothetical protein